MKIANHILLLFIFCICFSTRLIAQFISNSGAVINIASGTEISKGNIDNSSGTIANAGTITLDGSITNAGTLSGNGNYKIGVDWTNNGSFIPNTSTVTFNGAVAQTIGGSSVTSFNNIILNNITGAGLSSAQNLIGTLTLNSGTFTTTGQTFTLLSTASGTARIAAIPIGADITGNITMQRYVPAGIDGWMLLSTPVTGATLQQWDDDFVTGGFPGSQYTASPNPSIVSYDETLPGIYDAGYVTPINITDPITALNGYWAYILTSIAVNIDVSGSVIKNTQNFPVTYTDDVSQPAAEDGWNLIANPYPSTIDWDAAGWTKTNINNAVYIYNPTLDQYTSYIAGVGTNGGSNLIASSQGFLIQSNAANPVLQITENAKTATEGSFIRSPNTITDNFVKLNLEGNSYKDETIIRFNPNTSNSFDNNFDAMKFFSFNTDVPGISTIMGTVNYSVNSIPLLINDLSMSVNVKVGVSGTYTILLDALSNLPSSSCLILEDLLTGKKTDLRAAISYSFYINKTTSSPRFLLHIGDPSQYSTSSLCGSVGIVNPDNLSLSEKVKIVSGDNSIDLIFDFNESTNTVINIYNSIGQQVVVEKHISVYNNRISCDFSDKARGIYYIKIQAGDQIIIKKIARSN